MLRKKYCCYVFPTRLTVVSQYPQVFDYRALTCSPWGSGDGEAGECAGVCGAVDAAVAAAQAASYTLPCSCPRAAGVLAHA